MCCRPAPSTVGGGPPVHDKRRAARSFPAGTRDGPAARSVTRRTFERPGRALRAPEDQDPVRFDRSRELCFRFSYHRCSRGRHRGWRNCLCSEHCRHGGYDRCGWRLLVQRCAGRVSCSDHKWPNKCSSSTLIETNREGVPGRLPIYRPFPKGRVRPLTPFCGHTGVDLSSGQFELL